MAQFSLNTDGALHHLEGGLPQAPQLKLDALEGLKIPDLGAPAGSGFDFFGDVSKLATAVERKGKAGPTGLKLDEFDVSVPQLVIDTPKRDPIEALFRRAHQLLEAANHAGAAKLFDVVLAERPDHHEARYLRALCAAKLGEHMLALRTLAPLASVRLDNKLSTRVSILRGQLRGTMQLRILVQAALASRRGNPLALIAELQELATLDPECGQYHYLLAGFLLTLDRVKEARAAVDRGLAVTRDPEEREPLVGIQREIMRRFTREALTPVYQHYRARGYRAAAKALAGLSEEVRGGPVGTMLAPYLKKLQGGMFSRKKQPSDLHPDGDPKTLDDFHFGVVADELRQFRAVAAGGDVVTARRILLAAYEHAPAFPFLRFQLGTVLFHLAVERIQAGDGIESAFELLTEAKDHTRFAAQDPEIASAPQLLEVIEHIEGARRDTEVLGGLFERYAEIMASARGGIGSMARLREARAAMSTLQTTIKKTSLRGESARRSLRQLEEAVEGNLKQLRGLEPEIAAAEARHQLVKRVNDLGTRFGKITKNASGGISSGKQVGELQGLLMALKKDVTNARKEISEREALDLLGRLADAIDRNLEGLEEASASIAEVDEFKTLFEMFELTMDRLNSGSVGGRKEGMHLIGVLRTVRDKSGELQHKARSSSVKAQAGELESAVERILGQLGM